MFEITNFAISILSLLVGIAALYFGSSGKNAKASTFVASVFFILTVVFAVLGFLAIQGNDPKGDNSTEAESGADLPTPFSPESGSDDNTPDNNVLLSEDFEDGIADDFRFQDGDWEVVDDGSGNMVLEGNNMNYTLSKWPRVEFGPVTQGDYSIEYKVRQIDSSGMTWLGFRENSQGTYVFVFNSYNHDYAFTFHNPNSEAWEDFEVGKYDFQQNKWYTFRVEAFRSDIKVFLGDELIIEAQDSKLKTGSLTLMTSPDLIVQFDNVKISK